MGVKYFYNFCIPSRDDTSLEGDILCAVRKSYFDDFDKIRDKITLDSEGEYLLYDYCIEKDKPLRWSVRTADGTVVQDSSPAEGGRYYLNTYKDQKLTKRLLFSRLHTLLKAEYTDESGAVTCSVEPRKLGNGLCLLYRSKELQQPLILSEMPEVSDKRVLERVRAGFDDYTAAASTNDGIVFYLSDKQREHFDSYVGKVIDELSSEAEVSFIGDEAPLYEKINVKDFNIKRNLSASLDITMARDFAPAIEDDQASSENAAATDELSEASVEKSVITEKDSDIAEEKPSESVESAPELAEEKPGNEPEAPDEVSVIAPDEKTVSAADGAEGSLAESAGADNISDSEPEESRSSLPDKLIMADGAVYSYYGGLDENDNRSGYGRTMTDLGRTAYEGTYRGDKRSGKGAYFYKDGTLCYSGDWSENVRHGVGVGISARDGSMHIGTWKNNKPEGNGVRVSADGSVRFVCKEVSDGGTVLMNYTDDDMVIISRYDAQGSKISEKTVSLTDI